LAEVVQHYNRGGDVKDNLDINMVPLELSDAECADLVAFMESLTGKPREVTVPMLPR
jgi:cytochrome c peroxidase